MSAALESRAVQIARDYAFAAWRLPMLAGLLLLCSRTATSTTDWLASALPVSLGLLAVYAMPRRRLDVWISRGFLLASDALVAGLALLVARPGEPLPLAALSAAVLVGVALADVPRAIASSLAISGLFVAARSAGLAPGVGDAVTTGSLLLLLPSAAASFAAVAARRPAPALPRPAAHRASDPWALLDITETIGSTLEPGQVMRSIVRRVGDLMRVESCSILLAEEHGGCFVIAASGRPEVDMLAVDLGKYPEVQHALATGEPVVVEDVSSSPVVASVREVLLAKGYRSLLVVPLVYGRAVLGALFLRSRRADPFSPDEIRFCKLAAGASANALKNALLYRDVAAESEKNRAMGEKLRRILDGTPDMIVATDPSGRVTEFNRGAEHITGWTAARALGQPLEQILGSDLEAAPAANAGTEGFLRELTFQRWDGERSSLSLSAAALRDAEGQEAGRVWIGRDVTRLRRVERSLAQAERLSSLGEVVAGVAHELNNPLSGVVGYAELLRMHAVDPDQIRDLDRIVESAMRCQRIVLKLLSFARRHPPEKKSHDLNECVRKVLDLKSYHLRSSRIETRLELDPHLPRTSFDFYQIEQVVLNLLNNAEHAVGSTRGGGTIVLRTGSSASEVLLEVQDSGPGVPLAIRDRIFDPFFTTKDVGQGTGLGLSVSYGIVKEHGGRIDVGDARDGGARFTVLLPIVEAEEAALPAEAPAVESRTNRLRGRRILVVEDEPLVLELFSRVLEQDGVEVTLARDGQEALEKLAGAEYDLIVADLRMPNLDGRELYARVAEERPDMLRRFVFSTGDLVREDTVEFLAQLPNRLLTKPLEVETVRHVLSQVLETTAR